MDKIGYFGWTGDVMITSMANAQVKQLVVLGKKGKERAKQRSEERRVGKECRY